MEPFNPKKENVPYTIAIVKPDIVAEDEKVQEILTKLEAKFTIANMLKKELTKEEVINLYWNYRKEPTFDNMSKYMTNGECLIVMLTCEDLNPINELKKMLGPSDPQDAKKSDP